MSSSAYSASEYDAFVVGEWRPVRSYCPRRHRWVVDYAAPIVAATVTTVSDPDAAMRRERLPAKSAAAQKQADGFASKMGERRGAYEVVLVKAIANAGRPLSYSDATDVLGVGQQALYGLLDTSLALVRLGGKARGGYVGLAGQHTNADIPLTEAERIVRNHLLRTGRATQHDLRCVTGQSYLLASRLMHMLEQDGTKPGNPRVKYFKLRPEYMRRRLED